MTKAASKLSRAEENCYPKPAVDPKPSPHFEETLQRTFPNDDVVGLVFDQEHAILDLVSL